MASFSTKTISFGSATTTIGSDIEPTSIECLGIRQQRLPLILGGERERTHSFPTDGDLRIAPANPAMTRRDLVIGGFVEELDTVS